jgi:GntR family transcriptional regulator, transcriptional repressor for pyruvate dehydrogenase complex
VTGNGPELDESLFALAPVRQIAAHELVLDQIRTAILLGRFQPGEALPPERQLAEFLGVSRMTVREAVAVLAGEGILDVRRGRGGGLFVKSLEVDERASRESLRKSRDRLREVFDFRVAVESSCARLAAERRTATDLRSLRQLHRAMLEVKSKLTDDDPEHTAEFQRLDTQFHLSIAKAAKSAWLANAVTMARVEMFRPVGHFFKHLEPNADFLHDKILEAITDRDGELASALMLEHIEGTRQVVDAWIRPRGDKR